MAKGDRILLAESLDLGAVRLTDLFVSSEPLSAKDETATPAGDPEPPRAPPQAGAQGEDQDRRRDVGHDPRGRRDRGRAQRAVAGRDRAPRARPEGRDADREPPREVDGPAEAPHPRDSRRTGGTSRSRARSSSRSCSARSTSRALLVSERSLRDALVLETPAPARARAAPRERNIRRDSVARLAQALGPAGRARGPRPGPRPFALRPDAQPPPAHGARARVARARGGAPRHRALGRVRAPPPPLALPDPARRPEGVHAGRGGAHRARGPLPPEGGPRRPRTSRSGSWTPGRSPSSRSSPRSSASRTRSTGRTAGSSRKCASRCAERRCTWRLSRARPWTSSCGPSGRRAAFSRRRSA